MPKPRLLMIGDATRPTGFARVVESIAAELRAAWDIAILAVNYTGDWHNLQQHYRLYPAFLMGDAFGVGRVASLVAVEKPDAILIVQDAWNITRYLEALKDAPNLPPIVAYVPVDGMALRPIDVTPLNACDSVVAYTDFGARELRRAGLEVYTHVIPHGIDLTLFHPVNQTAARARAGLHADTYAVLVLDRNQPRKRLDIAFDAFRIFAAGKPPNVKLLYHGNLHDEGWDIEHMAASMGIAHRLILTSRDAREKQWRGVAVDDLPTIYSIADCKLSTTAGEGWGLTTMEAMACGVPNIIPQFAALGEWAKDAARIVPAVNPMWHPGMTTCGMTPDAIAVAHALQALYDNASLRADLRARGLALVAEDRFRWSTIAASFDALLRGAQLERAAAARPTRTVGAPITTRPGTIDDWVVEQVITLNEYGIGDLAPDDLVIDIGAHIGAFARLAYQHGSRTIEGYEADAANADLARQNLAGTGATITTAAVWRSDRDDAVVLFSGYDGPNTGAGNVVYGTGEQRPVKAIGLDTIIGDRHVAVLKIDAETAEFPILLTSRKLDQVDLIVGEYHEVSGPYDTNQMTATMRVGGAERYTASMLAAYLNAQGFDVTTTPYVLNTTGEPCNLGAFRAVRGERAKQRLAREAVAV